MTTVFGMVGDYTIVYLCMCRWKTCTVAAWPSVIFLSRQWVLLRINK